MFKILRFLAFIVLGIIAALLFAWWLFHEELPEAPSTGAADELARSMMASVNAHAWDSIPIIQWTFKKQHTFQWDKRQHQCLVRWEQYLVKLDINSATGKAYENDMLMEGPEASGIVKEAWDYFNNDSFWLNAVVKAFDPGTSRSIVTFKDGREGLKIHYSSGGSTPGDSYVWILDENNRPVAWKMWVDILPVGGMEFSWEDWITLPGGAQIATLHKSALIDLDISDVKAVSTWSELGYQENPLKELTNTN